jgi:two-component system LytT family response regulator
MKNSITKLRKDTSLLIFPYKGGYYRFTPEQIIRLESDSNYTYIHTTGRKPILMATVLGVYERMLQPFGFIRTHRSHLINAKHISGIHPAGDITMNDSSTVEISRRKRKDVVRYLNLSPQAA